MSTGGRLFRPGCVDFDAVLQQHLVEAFFWRHFKYNLWGLANFLFQCTCVC